MKNKCKAQPCSVPVVVCQLIMKETTQFNENLQCILISNNETPYNPKKRGHTVWCDLL